MTKVAEMIARVVRVDLRMSPSYRAGTLAGVGV